MPGPAHAALEADYPPLMVAQVEALRAYARDHGQTWRTELRAEWLRASAGPLLRGLHNSHGLAWLKGYALLAADPDTPPA